MPMASTDTVTEELDNHLGWEGWQIDLPADWNPIHFSGSVRAGRVVVADLERERLELSWRRVRSADGVDLARLARRGRKDKRHWEEMTGAPVGGVFAQGRSAPAADGCRIAIFVSRASRRLLFVRLAAETGEAGCGHDRILASLDDRAAHDAIPWSVYGFAWQVPSGFQRSGQTFQAGRLFVTFRKGLSERLDFERQMIGVAPAGASRKSAIVDDTLEHATHTVSMHRGNASSIWQRLLGRGLCVARWQCDVAERVFVVSAQGRPAAERVRKAVEGVACH
jgi:hypothetical protein